MGEETRSVWLDVCRVTICSEINTASGLCTKNEAIERRTRTRTTTKYRSEQRKSFRETGRTELVKKVFLTSSQTRSASLGSRLKKAACRCAHNLCANCAQIPHLRHVVCFARRTRRRAKRIQTLFRRARRNSTRFFDRLCASRLWDAQFLPIQSPTYPAPQARVLPHHQKNAAQAPPAAR